MARRSSLRQLLAVILAIGVVTAGVGAVAMVDRQAAPVGEADGALATTAAVVGVMLGVAACAELDIPVAGCQNVATDLQEADASETEKEIYTQMAQQEQNSQILLDSYDNYLKDTGSIARMEAKAAYIKALNNGSGESTARTKAREAVSSYYATKQLQLVSSWNTTLASTENARHTASNTTGVDSEFISVDETATPDSVDTINTSTNKTATISMVNSSSITVRLMFAELYYSTWGDENHYAAPNGSWTKDPDSTDQDMDPAVIIHQHQPNTNYEDITVLDPATVQSRWSTIESQNQQVQDEIGDFINATYDDYTTGDINTSDLSDPYLDAREYSPDAEYGTWLMSLLASVGVVPPDNISSIGSMTVDTENNGLVDGILVSQNDTDIEVGTQYDAANLTGKQVVIDREHSRKVEITGNFTVTNATTVDGNTTSTLSYTSVNYTTTDTQDYEALLDRIQNLTAQINAHQQALRNQAGGGLLSGLPDLQMWQWLLIGGGIFGALAARGRSRSPY